MMSGETAVIIGAGSAGLVAVDTFLAGRNDKSNIWKVNTEGADPD